MNTLDTNPLGALGARGLLKDCTDTQVLAQACLASPITVYAGFDPTAPGLHVGHMATVCVLREMAARGHRVIAVIGTATALVGDPTGRVQSRPVLDPETIERNAGGVEESIRRAMGEMADLVEFRRNGEWFAGLGWIEFLREVGRLVPVRSVLGLEGVRTRLESDGMSFLELAYPLMQAFDFLHLGREVGPLLQVGGSDQWGNICAGLDLIARSDGAHANPAFGLTHPLLTRADGTKMGKSADGAVWLNPSMLSDFEFSQFWRTLPDELAPRVAGMMCEQALLEEVLGRTDTGDGPGEVNPELLKERLAFAMTARLRGHEAAMAARQASRNRGLDPAGLPGFEVEPEHMADLAAACVLAGLAPSKAAARRLAAGGGLRVNGIARLQAILEAQDFNGGACVISAGRTRHAAIRLARSLSDVPLVDNTDTGPAVRKS